MGALLGLLLTIPLAAQVELEERTLARDWAALDLYHLSRSLPALGTIVDTPINPGVQVSYHHAWFGRRVTGGTTLQAGVVGFDELFWSLSTGAGFEGVWRTDSGFYSALGLRVDYARLFTGSNNFEFEDGRYRQATDSGRSFLRITLADLYLGFSRPMSRDALGESIRSGADLTPFLQKVSVSAGDYFELGPGVPHSLGPGMVVLEPQRVLPGKAAKMRGSKAL